MGCFVDSLDIYIGDRYTIESCRDSCDRYQYFAIKNGYQCYCDDYYRDVVSDKCWGAGFGGSAAVDVYENVDGTFLFYIVFIRHAPNFTMYDKQYHQQKKLNTMKLLQLMMLILDG